MEKFVKGDIVVIPFPYSDLSNAKKRPAFVLNSLPNQEVILCQITSQQPNDNSSIAINNADFVKGSLNQESHIRANRIFTADQSIILYKAGSLNSKKTEETINKVINLIRS
jgi:mRNA interferase MazF